MRPLQVFFYKGLLLGKTCKQVKMRPHVFGNAPPRKK
jgi:hypothetical protein